MPTRDSDPNCAGTEQGANRRDAMTEECAECGEPIAADEWHLVATQRDDDGDVEIYAFCSEDCRSSWRADVADDD